MPSPKIVTLRPEEFSLAIEVAKQRQVESLKLGLKDKKLGKPTGWRDGLGLHLYGATSELAVAKLLDRYWQAGVNQFSGMTPDVSSNIEVRFSTLENPKLIVRNGDPEDRIYVLVTGAPPDMTVHGWIEGKAAKEMKQYYTDYNSVGKPAYFIPRHELKEMDLLLNN